MSLGQKIYSCWVENVCTGEEYKRGRTFISETVLFLSEIVGKKDKCSREYTGITDSTEFVIGTFCLHKIGLFAKNFQKWL